MACWCETFDKEKSKAIADAGQRITELQAGIEEFTSRSAQLKVDVEQLKKEIGANTEALASASAIREKESAEFHEEEKNAITSISGLKNAVIALGAHHASA